MRNFAKEALDKLKKNRKTKTIYFTKEESDRIFKEINDSIRESQKESNRILAESEKESANFIIY